MQDKICLVTGASRGIGKEIAKKLALKGATVYAIDANTAEIPIWTKEYDIEENIIPCEIDITDFSKVKSLLMDIRKKYGRIDVLVNNAAVEQNQKLGMISRDSIEKMFNVNVFALIELLQITARIMQRNKSGSIINIASGVGEKGNAGQLVYSATKGAVIALTKSAAKELAADGIRVNAVSPGLTDTGMLAQADPAHIEKRINNIGMGRPAKPEEIADAVMFFAEENSGFISGQILAVDGCSLL